MFNNILSRVRGRSSNDTSAKAGDDNLPPPVTEKSKWRRKDLSINSADANVGGSSGLGGVGSSGSSIRSFPPPAISAPIPRSAPLSITGMDDHAGIWHPQPQQPPHSAPPFRQNSGSDSESTNSHSHSQTSHSHAGGVGSGRATWLNSDDDLPISAEFPMPPIRAVLAPHGILGAPGTGTGAGIVGPGGVAGMIPAQNINVGLGVAGMSRESSTLVASSSSPFSHVHPLTRSFSSPPHSTSSEASTSSSATVTATPPSAGRWGGLKLQTSPPVDPQLQLHMQQAYLQQLQQYHQQQQQQGGQPPQAPHQVMQQPGFNLSRPYGMDLFGYAQQYPLVKQLSPIAEQDYFSPDSLHRSKGLPSTSSLGHAQTDVSPSMARSYTNPSPSGSHHSEITRPSPVYSHPFINRPLNRTLSQTSSQKSSSSSVHQVPIQPMQPSLSSSSQQATPTATSSQPTDDQTPTTTVLPPLDLRPHFPGPHPSHQGPGPAPRPRRPAQPVGGGAVLPTILGSSEGYAEMSTSGETGSLHADSFVTASDNSPESGRKSGSSRASGGGNSGRSHPVSVPIYGPGNVYIGMPHLHPNLRVVDIDDLEEGELDELDEVYDDSVGRDVSVDEDDRIPPELGPYDVDEESSGEGGVEGYPLTRESKGKERAVESDSSHGPRHIQHIPYPSSVILPPPRRPETMDESELATPTPAHPRPRYPSDQSKSPSGASGETWICNRWDKDAAYGTSIRSSTGQIDPATGRPKARRPRVIGGMTVPTLREKRRWFDYTPAFWAFWIGFICPFLWLIGGWHFTNFGEQPPRLTFWEFYFNAGYWREVFCFGRRKRGSVTGLEPPPQSQQQQMQQVQPQMTQVEMGVVPEGQVTEGVVGMGKPKVKTEPPLPKWVAEKQRTPDGRARLYDPKRSLRGISFGYPFIPRPYHMLLNDQQAPSERSWLGTAWRRIVFILSRPNRAFDHFYGVKLRGVRGRPENMRRMVDPWIQRCRYAFCYAVVIVLLGLLTITSYLIIYNTRGLR
ncbi:hypothetical protein BDN72DRAFT_892153 [Pluteus cervinus]|uniref:Uncharacterized protein n=1 Tax=Pluteus cervinus TaxID=181527 RepID=A0ACD3BBX2_9AGAR|nr:hypothetical protein BDN72DRAFT_892153 [Pluteus cervinus]